jgi:hypothetical protein
MSSNTQTNQMAYNDYELLQCSVCSVFLPSMLGRYKEEQFNMSRKLCNNSNDNKRVANGRTTCMSVLVPLAPNI